MKISKLSKEEYDRYLEWRRDYNSKPEVKMKNRAYMQKYLAKPGIKDKIRKYNREYMHQYFQDKDKYALHVNRVKAGAIARKKAKAQARGAAIQQTTQRPTPQQYQR